MSIVLLGSTSGSCTLQEQAVAGTTTLTLPTFNGTVGLLVSGTSVASTSGTSIDFTGLPAGVRRITVMLAGVSTNGTNNIFIQLGTGATPTYTSSGYLSNITSGTGTTTAFTAGFGVTTTTAATEHAGILTFCLLNSATNAWVQNGNTRFSNIGAFQSAGNVALSGILTAIRITTAGGTDTFDAGSINILYE